MAMFLIKTKCIFGQNVQTSHHNYRQGKQNLSKLWHKIIEWRAERLY